MNADAVLNNFAEQRSTRSQCAFNAKFCVSSFKVAVDRDVHYLMLA